MSSTMEEDSLPVSPVPPVPPVVAPNTNWLKEITSPPNAMLDASSAGVEEQASNLLLFLNAKRKNHTSRPIIFIAHSLGGIIVKNALVQADARNGTSIMISNSTYGILFFGVPHRGTQLASWGNIAARIVALGGPGNEAFIESVKLGSPYNEQLNIEFTPLLDRYRFFTICETRPEVMYHKNLGIIVDKDSAVLKLPENTVREDTVYFNRTYRNICKFARTSEPEWEQLSGMLREAAECAVNQFSYSPDVLKRKEMLQDITWHVEDILEQDISREQAIRHAQHVVQITGEDSPENAQLHEIQITLDSLMGGMILIVGWLLGKLGFLLLGPTMIPYIPAIMLPGKPTIMEKANQIIHSQQEVVQTEFLIIDRLNEHNSNAREALKMLQLVSSSEFSQDALDQNGIQLPAIPTLQRALEYNIERIIPEMAERQRGYLKAVAELRRQEEGMRIAEAMNEKELYLWIADNAAKEKANRVRLLERASAEEKKEMKEESWCPWLTG